MLGIAADHKGIGTFLFSEIIEEVDSILLSQKPLTPTFLHDLGALAEAVCLSNCYSWAQAPGKSKEGAKLLIAGPVAETLMVNEALRIYHGNEIESEAKACEKDFSFGEFLSHHYMFPYSFRFQTESFPNLVEQYIHFLDQWRGDPLRRWAKVLGDDWAVVDPGGIYPVSQIMHIGSHFYKVIESHRFKVKAAQYVVDAFKLDNLYLPLFGTPHSISKSYLEASNVIRDLLKSAELEIERVEERFEPKTAFGLLPIPNFARILLSKVTSRDEIPKQLLMLRERYGGFREELSNYNERVKNATSIIELQRIDHEVKKAWSNLISKEEGDLGFRLTYRIWDIIKKGPMMLIEFIDSLKRKDELEHPIFHISGFYDLWSDLKMLPPRWHNLSLIESVFKESIPPADVGAYVSFCEKIEPLVSDRS